MAKLTKLSKRLTKEGKNLASFAQRLCQTLRYVWYFERVFFESQCGSKGNESLRIDSDEKYLILNTAEGRVKTSNMGRDPKGCADN